MMIQLNVQLNYLASGEACDNLLHDLEMAAEHNEGMTLRIAGHPYEVEVASVKELQA